MSSHAFSVVLIKGVITFETEQPSQATPKYIEMNKTMHMLWLINHFH